MRTGRFVGLTLAALAVVVAVQIVFVLLQAIFPEVGRGSFAEPFGRVLPVLGDPALLRLAANTVLLGLAVVLGSAALGIPLGVLRALFDVPLARLWDVLLLVPLMVPP